MFPPVHLKVLLPANHLILLIFIPLPVVEYREAEYRDHQVQGFICHFGLDTPDKHGLLDQRSAFETNYQVAKFTNQHSL